MELEEGASIHMNPGKQIKTLEHVHDWCVVQRKRVVIKAKKGSGYGEHSHKVVLGIPLGSLCKMLRQGRLFESHDSPKNLRRKSD
jgi:hypothetical protein